MSLSSRARHHARRAAGRLLYPRAGGRVPPRANVLEAPPGRDTQADFLYTAALGIGLSEEVGLFVESFGFAGLEESRPARHALDGGFTYLVRPDVQLDVRAGVGLEDDAEDWMLGAGVSLRLPR